MIYFIIARESINCKVPPNILDLRKYLGKFEKKILKKGFY